MLGKVDKRLSSIKVSHMPVLGIVRVEGWWGWLGVKGVVRVEGWWGWLGVKGVVRVEGWWGWLGVKGVVRVEGWWGWLGVKGVGRIIMMVKSPKQSQLHIYVFLTFCQLPGPLQQWLSDHKLQT